MEPSKDAKDTRTLIRHVLPGLVFIAELIGFCFLGGVAKPEDISAAFAGEKSALAVVVAGFLASGAAGYLLANLHHAVLNTSCPWLRRYRLIRWIGDHWPTINYQPALKYLVAEKKLLAKGIDGGAITFENQDPLRDWVITTALWHERREDEANPQFKAATARADSLFDTAHGAGTLLVGSIVAWLCAFLAWFSQPSWWLLLLVPGLLLVAAHYWSFCWTLAAARNFVGTILVEQICREASNKVVEVFYFDPRKLGVADPGK